MDYQRALAALQDRAQAGKPAEEALVSAGAFGTATDASGGFLVPGLSPGAVKIRAYQSTS